MTNSNKIVLAVIVVVILVITAFSFSGHTKGLQLGSTLATPSCGDQTSCTSGNYYVTGTFTAGVLQTINDILIPRGFYLGGATTGASVQMQATRQAVTSATTTLCAIQNPIGATSTVQSFTLNLTTGTSTPANGINYVVGTSTSAFSTSTSMIPGTNGAYVIAGQLATLSWDPGVLNGVIGPTQWITVGALSSSTITGSGGIVISGVCSATFVSAN